MCGRYTLTTKPKDLAVAFGLAAPPVDLQPRYNIAPSQSIAVITGHQPRQLDWFRWGLVPSWAKDPAIGHRMINARAETAAEKPSFRSALRRRRCLIPADGFYEWRREGKHKVPTYIRLTTHQPFAFAGLWETWKATNDETLRTCTILTTTPNEFVAPIHDRMPVILAPQDYDVWLDEEVHDSELLRHLLVPYPAEGMEAFSVSTLVNAPANDGPECLEPRAKPV